MSIEGIILSTLDWSLLDASNIPKITDVLEENLRRAGVKPRGVVIPPHPEERIEFLSKYYTWSPIKQSLLSNFEKKSEASVEFRTIGNDNYGRGYLKDGLKFCNLAIMFAENEDENLGLAYANRSQMLLDLGDARGALEDIELALKHQYPQRLFPKLEKRRAKCEEMLKKDEEDLRVKSRVEEDMKERKEYRDREILRIKSPNLLMPAAEDFVKIEYDEMNGRQLVVSGDVSVGTVLIVEDPFVKVSEAMPGWELEHCSHCLKFIRRGIPCKSCTQVLYCSESCMTKAEREYHRYECKCLSYLYLNSDVCNTILAFRIICKVGPEELFRIYSTKDAKFTDDAPPFGSERGCHYDSDSYLPIFHLVRHSEKLKDELRLSNAITALTLADVLDTKTEFFRGIPEEHKLDFKKFVGSTLLRHMEAIPHNQIGLNEIKDLREVSLQDIYRDRAVAKEMTDAIRDTNVGEFFGKAGTGVFAVASLINHSCDPNVYRVNDVHNGTLIVVATRNIKKGEQLTTMYGQAFWNPGTSLQLRQAYLQLGYHFKCQCIACREDWPFDLPSRDPVFCCSICSTKFPHEEKTSGGEFAKSRLAPPNLTCRICGKRYTERSLMAQLESNMTKFTEAYMLTIQNRPVGAIPKFKECASFFQFNLSPPYGPIYPNQYTFHQALALILRYAE